MSTSSEPETEELRPLLTPPLEQRRPSTRSLGCLCTVIFLQVVCLGWLYRIVKDTKGLDIFFHFDAYVLTSSIAGTIYMYLLAIFGGLYIDIVLGRYRTLLFALGLNISGSLLAFIAVIVWEAEQSTDPVALRVLFAMWCIGNTWMVSGSFVTILTALTFSMQQVEQTIPALSRICRWVTVAVMAAFSVVSINFYVHLFTLFGVFGERYNFTVGHAVFVAVGGCSVAVFLCGKTDYRHTDSRTDDGKKSWNEFVRIFLTYIICRKNQNEDSHMDDFRQSAERALARRRLDRLKLKKGALMIALLSCTAVTMAMSYSAYLVFVFSSQRWNPWWGPPLVKDILYITPIIGVTVLEIIRKCSGHHLWQNSCVNILKTIGVGSSLAALSVALAGAAITLIYQHEVMSPLWFLPSYILMGLTVFFVYPPLMVLCYSESPPGMATIVSSLAASLSVLFFSFRLVLFVAIPEPNQSDRFDTVSYGLAGAMVVVVALYISISTLYIKADRAIKEAELLVDSTAEEMVASTDHSSQVNLE